eukprot:1139412-Pelagomonas_calceolata.AAC.9
MAPCSYFVHSIELFGTLRVTTFHLAANCWTITSTDSFPTDKTVQNLVSEGSVASDAEKLAKPVLPDTDVALNMECLEATTHYLPAADHALFMRACMHACIAHCTPASCFCHSLPTHSPPRQPAADHKSEAP